MERLQEVLQEETALHAILENDLDHAHAAVTLADMSYLPAHVRTHALYLPIHDPSTGPSHGRRRRIRRY